MLMDEVEVEIPIALSSRKARFDPKESERLPQAAQLLAIPFSPETAARPLILPEEAVAGWHISAELVTPHDKVMAQATAPQVGRLRIRIRPTAV